MFNSRPTSLDPIFWDSASPFVGVDSTNFNDLTSVLPLVGSRYNLVHPELVEVSHLLGAKLDDEVGNELGPGDFVARESNAVAERERSTRRL